jgi:hypothetical protein
MGSGAHRFCQAKVPPRWLLPWQNDGKSRGVEQYGWSGKECLAQENFAGTKILFACEKLLHAAAIPDRANSLERFDQSWIHNGKIAKNSTLRLFCAVNFGNFASSSAKVLRQKSVTSRQLHVELAQFC